MTSTRSIEVLMADRSLKDRQHALEDAFYREDTETYRDQLKLGREEKSALAGLAAASDISDEAVLRRLAGLGIRADTLAALTLIPLIEVLAESHGVGSATRAVQRKNEPPQTLATASDAFSALTIICTPT